MKHFKAHVNVPHCEWKVTYADDTNFHHRAYTRNPEFVFGTIKKDFREFLIELVHQRMAGPHVLTDEEYRVCLMELADCFKEVMAGFKVIHPDFETDKGIRVQRFISRLEVMDAVGVDYLLGVLFPENSRMIRVTGTRFATELWRRQDSRVQAVLEVMMFRGRSVDMTYHSPGITSHANAIPAEAMRLTFERICTTDDVDVFPHLKKRAEYVLDHEALPGIMEGVCKINYQQ